jgi:hypothetical protein
MDMLYSGRIRARERRDWKSFATDLEYPQVRAPLEIGTA